MMAYKVARTTIPGMSFRPFNERLGEYRRSTIVIPTQSQRNEPLPGPVSGGLGLDLSSLTTSPLFWLALLGGGLLLFARKR
jgi:hypothetical protein